MVLHFPVSSDGSGNLEDNGIGKCGRAPLEDSEVCFQGHGIVKKWEVLNEDMKGVKQWETTFIPHAIPTHTVRNGPVIGQYSIICDAAL